ncbi:MAG TPA: hypothetical protein VMT50_12385 [Steroidobacteraceae bacterium]|nr:hypothetical protein [Steroidobacteraceae bacterium]
MNPRALFTAAAAFNVLVGVPMLVAYPLVASLLGLEGPPTVWYHIAAAIVLIYGYAYACVARDPHRYRPYVVLGILGKLSFVAAIYGHWVAGSASGRCALLVTVDLLFAILFFAYLRAEAPMAPAAPGA